MSEEPQLTILQNQEKTPCVPGLTFNIFHVFPHFMTQHPHFRDDKTGAQRGEATCS